MNHTATSTVPPATDRRGSNVPSAFTPVVVDVAAIAGSAPTPQAPPDGAGPPGPRIIAMMNQKGGVGKTTSTVNLGAALAAAGQRVLMIDLDPQAHLTLHMGIDPNTVERSVYHLLTDPAITAKDVLQQARPGIAVLPAETNLAGIESELAPQVHEGQAQHLLRDKVRTLLDEMKAQAGARTTGPAKKPRKSATPKAASTYDFILLDCPPSLGLLTINGLALAQEVCVPMQAHFLALQGLSKLLETVGLVKQSLNPQLTVCGVILCMHEGQTILASEVVSDLKAFLDAARNLDVPWRDAVVFEPAIRRNIKLAECPSFGKTIFDYEPTCAGAHDYQLLAAALAAHQPATRAAAPATPVEQAP